MKNKRWFSPIYCTPGFSLCCVQGYFLQCKKTKTVRTATKMIDNPAKPLKKRRVLASLKRGEYVNSVKEKSFQGKKFTFIELPGIDDKGWVQTNDLLDGEFKNVVVIKDSILYKRPSVKFNQSGYCKNRSEGILIKNTRWICLDPISHSKTGLHLPKKILEKKTFLSSPT